MRGRSESDVSATIQLTVLQGCAFSATNSTSTNVSSIIRIANMSRVYLTQYRTPSASPPPSLATYKHLPIRPPVVPERRTAPTSYPTPSAGAPRSSPRYPVIVNTPPPPPPTIRFDSYEDIYSRGAATAHSRRAGYGHSRSSSQTSSQRSLSPPSTRSASPSSCSSRSSSTSGKSVRFAETNDYSPAPAPAFVEYVSSRGAAYHVSEHRGRARSGSVREYRDTDTLVVEKTRRGGREGRRRACTVADELEVRRERHW